MNTFAPKVPLADGSYHPVHEFCDTVKNIYNDDFLKSPEFAAFKERTKRDTICFSLFKRGATMCPCIQKPKMRVCVDEVETAFNELTKTLASMLRRQPAVIKGAPAYCRACEVQAARKEELGLSKHNFQQCTC